jgi:hypothetical protein
MVGEGTGTFVGEGTGTIVGAGTGADDGLRVWTTEVTASKESMEEIDDITDASKAESVNSASISAWKVSADASPISDNEATTSKVTSQVPVNSLRNRRRVLYVTTKFLMSDAGRPV